MELFLVLLTRIAVAEVDAAILIGGPIKNGDFNANPGTSVDFASTSDWVNLGTSGQTIGATTGGQYHYDGPYWAPYRTLYNRNISNLFMAGRNISVTHEALGPVRVMRTTGMMGEVVGMAAAICKKYDCTPRQVYQNHLDELHELMRKGVN